MAMYWDVLCYLNYISESFGSFLSGFNWFWWQNGWIFEILKIAIRRNQKINSRIDNSRIAIRQRIAQLGLFWIGGGPATNGDHDHVGQIFPENDNCFYWNRPLLFDFYMVHSKFDFKKRPFTTTWVKLSLKTTMVVGFNGRSNGRRTLCMYAS